MSPLSDNKLSAADLFRFAADSGGSWVNLSWFLSPLSDNKLFAADLFRFAADSGFQLVWPVECDGTIRSTPSGLPLLFCHKIGSGGSWVNLSWFLSPLSDNKLFAADLFRFAADSGFQLVWPVECDGTIRSTPSGLPLLFCHKIGSGGSWVNLSLFLSPLSDNKISATDLFCFAADSGFQLVWPTQRIGQNT